MYVRAVALCSLLCLTIALPVRADVVIDGQTGPGSLYRIVMPTNWNGRLVLYAHGSVATDQPVALPAEADLLVSLLAPQGFAVAYSSFSENGWAVKDGVQLTHQLIGLFTSKFGSPAGVHLSTTQPRTTPERCRRPRWRPSTRASAGSTRRRPR